MEEDDEPDDVDDEGPEDECDEEGTLRRAERDVGASCLELMRELRPRVAERTTPSVEFMVMDVVMQRNRKEGSTEALLFGRERGGGSVCVVVQGWQPYLFVAAPAGWRDAPDRCERVRTLLEEKLDDYLQLTGEAVKKRAPHIFAVSTLERQRSIFGFAPDESAFLKIEVAHPQLIGALRDVLVGYPHEKGRAPGVVVRMESPTTPCLAEGQSETFNSNLDAVLQFMVDAGLRGCQWVTARATVDADGKRVSACTYEMRTRVEDLLTLSEEEGVAPLRVLSFDIEAAGRRGVFPQAEVDPVIQIALQFLVVGGGEAAPAPVLLSLKACDPIEGARVLCFEDELELLLCFRDLAVAFDTDIFSGYNVCGFDFGYLQRRAEALRQCETDLFDALTRMPGRRMQVRETEFFSAQMGKQRRVKVTIAGRGVLDMLMAIRNNTSYRLEKYTLDAVSAYFLGDHKKDVHFTQITPMWLKDAASRRELGEYCLHDAKLPLELMVKLDALTQTMQMAEAVGVPFDYVLQRGQMIRNTSLLLRRAKVRGFVFPNKAPFAQRGGGKAIETGRSNRYQGATVLEPKCGIHRMVGVVDFSAMYPSIMRAHNICASSLVMDASHPFFHAATDEARGLLRVGPHLFVSERHVKGLVPEVVELLQHCRTKAKQAYAAATDPLQKKVAKARELAYKVAGNGVYGALGSALSLVPLMAIAETVTAIGRQDIMLVKKTAEEMFPEALVVYGDTDSVFVRHHLPPEVASVTQDAVGEASRLTLALAEAVNAMMKPPKKLEFEKVYGTMLLLSKKRYGGLLYAPNHEWGKEPPIDIKGLQSQRRDGCPLVRDLVRDCLSSILCSGGFEDAGALVRLRVTELMDDALPLEAYAIQKTLRKTMQDICFPMSTEEVATLRRQLVAAGNHVDTRSAQLTYAEQDDAIRLRLRLPWQLRVRLPHVLLAYRMREKDAGAAPVSGDVIRYLVTNNGRGSKIWEKVETLEDVRQKGIVVDRKYYLESLRTPLMNMFLPIMMQRMRNAEAAKREAERVLFGVTKGRAWRRDAALRQTCLANSPLLRAFAVQSEQSKKKARPSDGAGV